MIKVSKILGHKSDFMFVYIRFAKKGFPDIFKHLLLHDTYTYHKQFYKPPLLRALVKPNEKNITTVISLKRAFKI